MRFGRGLLIVLEGIDGAGKSTQVDALARALLEWGFSVVRTKEPTDGPWGRHLRASATSGRLSLDEELEAFMNDRRAHVREVIQPALDAGQVVVVDRYYYSTAAYQGSRGADWRAIIRDNEAFAPRPDLLLLVHVDPATGLSRIRGRGDRANLFEQTEQLERADRIFRALEGPHVVHLDGMVPAGALTERILAAVLSGPLKRRLCARPEGGAVCAGPCRAPDACPWGRLAPDPFGT